MTSAAADAAQVTIGSSQFAMTCTCGFAVSMVRHFAATVATSCARSSWSRLRFSSATTSAFVFLRTSAR